MGRASADEQSGQGGGLGTRHIASEGVLSAKEDPSLTGGRHATQARSLGNIQVANERGGVRFGAKQLPPWRRERNAVHDWFESTAAKASRWRSWIKAEMASRDSPAKASECGPRSCVAPLLG